MPVSEIKPPIHKGWKQGFPPGPVLRKTEEFEQNLGAETAYRVSTARVVFANHDLLQHDFPHLRDETLEQKHPELQHLNGADKTLAIRRLLENWLKTHTAFISENQARQALVNTPIETTTEKVRAFRPPRYGRALIFSLRQNEYNLQGTSDSKTEDHEGLLDAKGVGVASYEEPSFRSQSNGLMMLGEAFREVVVQEMLDKVFRHAESAFWTVPHYGVLDLGFDIKLKSGERLPAGIVVRRAHRRKIYEKGLQESSAPEVQIEFEIELLLRRYGFTSVSNLTTIEIFSQMGVKYGSSILTHYKDHELEWIKKRTGFSPRRRRFEGLNIQFTREVSAIPPRPQIIDYGGFRVKQRFDNPIVSLVSDRPLRLGETIYPDSPRFVQPDERISPPYKFWGTTPDGEIWGYKAFDTGLPKSDLQKALTNLDNPDITDIDNPKILAFNLAREFREGKLTGPEVRDKLDMLLQTATSRWHQF